MLNNIPNNISPDLMKYMMEMGHSDQILIADANFPAKSNAKRFVLAEGVLIDELLTSILQFFPLDNFITHPVTVMNYRESESKPKVWDTYDRILREYDQDQAFTEFKLEERLAFYELSRQAYCVIQTSDTRRYGNILLQKGVC